MGYGSRALQLLQMYYEGKFPCLEEKVLETPQEIRTVSSEVTMFWQSQSPKSERMVLWGLLRLGSQPLSSA
jgi:N-acetyltransferase 10